MLQLLGSGVGLGLGWAFWARKVRKPKATSIKNTAAVLKINFVMVFLLPAV